MMASRSGHDIAGRTTLINGVSELNQLLLLQVKSEANRSRIENRAAADEEEYAPLAIGHSILTTTDSDAPYPGASTDSILSGKQR
jgi:hypothetical protein